MKGKGFSLIEAVVYVALLGVVAVFVVNSLLYLTDAYTRVRAEREVLTNARAVIDLIGSRVASSRETYAFTSKFDADDGQLSLITAATTTPGHAAAYSDVWISSGAVYAREEGSATTTLSAGSVQVSLLRFERIAQSPKREAVRATIRVDAAGARHPTSMTLTTTIALRGNY